MHCVSITFRTAFINLCFIAVLSHLPVDFNVSYSQCLHVVVAALYISYTIIYLWTGAYLHLLSAFFDCAEMRYAEIAAWDCAVRDGAAWNRDNFSFSCFNNLCNCYFLNELFCILRTSLIMYILCVLVSNHTRHMSQICYSCVSSYQNVIKNVTAPIQMKSLLPISPFLCPTCIFSPQYISSALVTAAFKFLLSEVGYKITKIIQF